MPFVSILFSGLSNQKVKGDKNEDNHRDRGIGQDA